MAILTLIGVVLGILLIYGSLHWFNKHCEEKFSYRFLNKQAFTLTATSLGLIVGGYSWKTHAIANSGDPLNGIILIVIGALISLALIYINFNNTNLLYGFFGSVLQICLFSFLAYLGFFALVIGLIFSFLEAFNTQRVYVVNR